MFHRTKQISESDSQTVMSFMSMISKEVVLRPSALTNCVCEKDDPDSLLREGMSGSGLALHKPQGISGNPPSNSIAGSKRKPGEPGEPDDEDSVLRIGTPDSDSKGHGAGHGQAHHKKSCRNFETNAVKNIEANMVSFLTNHSNLNEHAHIFQSVFTNIWRMELIILLFGVISQEMSSNSSQTIE